MLPVSSAVLKRCEGLTYYQMTLSVKYAHLHNVRHGIFFSRFLKTEKIKRKRKQILL
jgi:hypothetical protein